MERTDLFPTLQPSDILRHFRDSLGLTFVTEEMVLRPGSESVKQIFSRLLEISLNDSRSQLERAYPDFHEGSIPTVHLYWKVRSLLSKLGCKDEFRLQDFLYPDFKRTRKFFSAFINFIKFRTDEEIFSDQIQGVRDTSFVQEDYQKINEELKCNQAEVESLRIKLEGQKDSVEEKQARIEELERLKLKAETTQTQVLSAVQQLSGELQTITDSTNFLKLTESAQREKLCGMQQQVIPYPEPLLTACKKGGSNLKSEEQSRLEIEQKAKELAKRFKALQDAKNNVELAMSDMQIFRMSKTQLTATKMKESAVTKDLQALSRTEELLKVKITTSQRLMDTKFQQTSRDRESTDARLLVTNTQLRLKAEELMTLKSQCKEKREAVQMTKHRIEDIKATEKMEEEMFRRKMKQGTDALEAIKQAWEKHDAWLVAYFEKLKTNTHPDAGSITTST